MRWLPVLIATLLLASCFNGSSAPEPGPKPENELRFVNVGPFRPSFTPLLLRSRQDFLLAQNIASTLVRVRLNGEVESAFASNWTRSVDGRSWTFFLRSDLKWSDGSPLSPSQILESLRKTIYQGRNKTLARIIQKLSLSPSGNQLIFDLRGDSKDFLRALSHTEQAIWDFPKEATAEFKIPSGQPGVWPRLTGAYRITSWDTDQIKLEANAHFKALRPLGPSKFVRIIRGRDLSHAVELLSTGKADILQAPSDIFDAASLEKLRSSGNFEYREPSRSELYWLIFGKQGLRFSKRDRQYLFRFFWELSSRSLGPGEIPAYGLTPAFLPGASTREDWEKQIASLPEAPENRKPIDLYVLDVLAENGIFRLFSTALERSALPIRLVTYNSNNPESAAWKNRESGSYGILAYFTSLFYSDPDPVWRVIRKQLPKTPFALSESSLERARSAQRPEQRESLYQAIEKANLANPFAVPLRFTGQSTFINGKYGPPESGPYDFTIFFQDIVRR